MSRITPPAGVVRVDRDGFPLAVGLNRFGSHVVAGVNGFGQAWFMGSWGTMVELGETIPEDRLAFVGWVVEAGS